MSRFVVLTVEAHGAKGTFAGTCEDAIGEQEAFAWAWPLAKAELPAQYQHGATVSYFHVGPEEWGH